MLRQFSYILVQPRPGLFLGRQGVVFLTSGVNAGQHVGFSANQAGREALLMPPAVFEPVFGVGQLGLAQGIPAFATVKSGDHEPLPGLRVAVKQQRHERALPNGRVVCARRAEHGHGHALTVPPAWATDLAHGADAFDHPLDHQHLTAGQLNLFLPTAGSTGRKLWRR